MIKLSPEKKTEQQTHWDGVFSRESAFFGRNPSEFGKASLEIFQRKGVRSLLELGCGQGRDTFHFAQSGIHVTALDYSEKAVAEITEKANSLGLSPRLRSLVHDVREPLPYHDDSFDACFSHMLLCMELSTDEIAYVLQEVHRVLVPGGLAVYSVRSAFDKHFRAGTHLGEDIYEIGGFVIHFFSREKIKKLGRGYEILNIERREEGSLPRDLFCVCLKKGPAPESWDISSREVTNMNDAQKKFKTFMDAALAPGVLDHKTKQLVALGAALAAGCDPSTDYGLAVAGQAGVSEEEMEEVAAIAMTVNAFKTRSLFYNKVESHRESPSQTVVHPPDPAPGKS